MPTGKKAFYSHPAAMSKKLRLFLLGFAAGVLILQSFYKCALLLLAHPAPEDASAHDAPPGEGQRSTE